MTSLTTSPEMKCDVCGQETEDGHYRDDDRLCQDCAASADQRNKYFDDQAGTVTIQIPLATASLATLSRALASACQTLDDRRYRLEQGGRGEQVGRTLERIFEELRVLEDLIAQVDGQL